MAIGIVLSSGGHGASASSAPPAAAQAPTSVTPSSANAAAVTQALAHGTMNVVVDQPSEAAFGEENRLIEGGAQVASEEANSSGQLPGHLHIKLVPERLDGLSPGAIEERLRTDAAGVLVLPCDTNSQPSIAAAAAHNGTLMIAPCNDEPLAAERYSSYWPVGSAANEEMAELVSFMLTQGYLHAYVVRVPGSHYAELLTSYFERGAKSKNIRIVGSTSVSPSTQDFTEVAKTIKGLEPQPTAVFTALPPPGVNRLGAALRAQGVTAAVVGTSVMDSRFTLASGEGLENAILSSTASRAKTAPPSTSPPTTPSSTASRRLAASRGLGYETVRLLEEAVSPRAFGPAERDRSRARERLHAQRDRARRSPLPTGLEPQPAERSRGGEDHRKRLRTADRRGSERRINPLIARRRGSARARHLAYISRLVHLFCRTVPDNHPPGVRAAVAAAGRTSRTASNRA